MGSKSRNKGKVGERLARDFLRSLGFDDARRGQQYSGIESEGRDVVCLESLPHLHFEVKYGYGKVDCASSLLVGWYEQAQRDAWASRRVPLVLWKPNRARRWRLTAMYYGLFVTVAEPESVLGLIRSHQEMGACADDASNG